MRLCAAFASQVISCDSCFSQSFKLGMLLLVLLISMWVPFQVAFLWKASNLTSTSTTSIDAALDWIVTVVLVIDVVANFLTSYVVEGREITDVREIAKRYATSWLVIDLLAAFPYGRAFPKFGWANMLKILRLPLLWRAAHEALSSTRERVLADLAERLQGLHMSIALVMQALKLIAVMAIIYVSPLRLEPRSFFPSASD